MRREILVMPCPFCGQLPQFEQAEGGELDIACLNISCAVQPRALGLPNKPARDSWNRRLIGWDVRLKPLKMMTVEALAQKLTEFKLTDKVFIQREGCGDYGCDETTAHAIKSVILHPKGVLIVMHDLAEWTVD